MCGIFGRLSIGMSIPTNRGRFESSLSAMHHRGPDAKSTRYFNEDMVGLGHVRLSVIDTRSVNNQPFTTNDIHWIVYNGEIYNYLELRKELQVEGFSFRTEGDTEVLLNAYLFWGEDCVKRFNGDWAFAIYDTSKNKLFCSRDRFGVKPFNYIIDKDEFVFASEIKSILKYRTNRTLPNYNVIANFCRNSLGAQANETWFKDILRLPPAHNLVITDDVRIYPYWSYPVRKKTTLDAHELSTEYLRLFERSVEIRMRSDVPFGASLSSGLDSTSIVCSMRKQFNGTIRTYSAIFSDEEFTSKERSVYKTDVKINEYDLIRRLNEDLSTTPEYVFLRDLNFIESLTRIIYHLESGHSSPAVVPLDLVHRKASENVKVILEGQGADELLGGYVIKLFIPHILDLMKKGKYSSLIKEISTYSENYSIRYSLLQYLRDLQNRNIELGNEIINGSKFIYGGNLNSYVRIPDFNGVIPDFDEPMNKHLFKSHAGGLVNLLHYGDAISMSHSVESRLPFMDVDLVEFVFSLPFEFKYNGSIGKIVHRSSMKGIVPDYILDNRIKFGFNTPIFQLFRGRKAKGSEILLSKRCLDRGLFSEKGLRRLIDRVANHKGNGITMLYRFLVVEIWHRVFIDE